MTRAGTTTTGWRWLAPGLVLIALLLRIAVPVGWMPAEGGFGIVPCTGTGPMTPGVATPSHHHHGGSKREDTQAQPCAFAPFAVALDMSVPPVEAPASLPLAMQMPLATPAGVSIGRGLAAPPPPSTGPPRLL